MQIGDKNPTKIKKWDQIMETVLIYGDQKAQGATRH